MTSSFVHKNQPPAQYDGDAVAWAHEQVRLLKARRFDELDVEHVIEEIEDMAKRERQELKNRMAILIAHLLKWKYQPEMRQLGKSWFYTIRAQRTHLNDLLEEMPSLKPALSEAKWIRSAYADAVALASRETGLSNFPDALEWEISAILDEQFFPET